MFLAEEATALYCQPRSQGYILRSTVVVLCSFILLRIAPAQALEDWQRSNGPFGGEVLDLCVDSRDVMYAITRSDLYRLPPASTRWEHLWGDATSHRMLKLAINSREVLCLLTTEGVMISRNRGETWHKTSRDNFTFSPYEINVVVATTSGHFLLMRDSGGILRSTDDGQSWTSKFEAYRFGEDGAGRLFAYNSQANSISRSTDEGETWQRLSVEPPREHFRRAAGGGGTFLLFSTDYLLLTTDGGESWHVRDLPSGAAFRPALGVDAGGRIFINGSKGNYFSSRDHGLRWEFNDTDNARIEVTSFLFYKNTIYCGSRHNGVNLSIEQSNSWLRLVDGLTASAPQSISSGSNGEIYASTTFGAFRSDDQGANWEEIWHEPKKEVSLHSIFAASSGIVLLASSRGPLSSENAGTSWRKSYCDIFNRTWEFAENSDGSILALLDEFLLHSIDNGRHWRRVPGWLPFFANRLGVNDRGFIFIGANPHVTDQYGPQIRYSRDGGQNWNALLFNLELFAVARERHLLASSDPGSFLHSGDGGLSWTERLLPVEEQEEMVTSFVFNAAEDSAFVATDIGRFYRMSLANGSLASLGNTSLGVSILNMTLVGDTLLYAATEGAGVYRIRVARGGAVDRPNSSADTLQPSAPLARVFPNPVDREARILLESEVEQLLRLDLYTATGRRIGNMYRGRMPPGRTNLALNFAALADGIYYLRLQRGRDHSAFVVVVAH